MIVFGGMDNHNRLRNDIATYSIHEDKWDPLLVRLLICSYAANMLSDPERNPPITTNAAQCCDAVQPNDRLWWEQWLALSERCLGLRH